MKNILNLFILLMISAQSFGQNAKIKKLVTDDSIASFKADTSIVTINDSAFQKVVSVRYKFISEEILLENFQRKSEYVKQQIEQERQNRERSNQELDRLRAELEAERNFYRTARKELKYNTKEADEINAKAEARQKENEIRNAKIDIQDNPRRSSKN